MLGYFKSRKIFFTYTREDVITDISYILACHFPDHSAANIKVPGKTTRIQLQRLICQHLNYQRYGSVMAEQLAELAARVVKRSAKPVFILRALLSHLNKNQIIPPAYSTFQDLIGRCLSDERRRICEQLKSDLNPDVEEALTNLLSEESGGLHWITQLKKALRDFSYTEIVRESTWVKQLSPLYEFGEHKKPWGTRVIWRENRQFNQTITHYRRPMNTYTVKWLSAISVLWFGGFSGCQVRLL
ncbi:hypothetical protein C5471_02925 [Photorhabdus tasmaniensis]|uniref:DUF4158 domain-containing protein n=2 Tax=Photorhabdus tasmaniensis TaxID=1004159 RepID=A0ABX0GCG4_9GAMM|nr:hypothetical protein [Photorhabdus tasmaniensis]